MSENSDLRVERALLSDLLDRVSDMAKPQLDGQTGGLFPNGVDYIRAVLKVGVVDVELEVSGSVPKSSADDRRINVIRRYFIHPMAVYNPTGAPVWITVYNDRPTGVDVTQVDNNGIEKSVRVDPAQKEFVKVTNDGNGTVWVHADINAGSVPVNPGEGYSFDAQPYIKY